MAYPTTYTYRAADVSYICAAQTRSGAGALTLNGTGVDQTSTYLLNNPRMTLTGSGFARPVSLTSSGTTSSVTFAITGKDIRGAAVTENITGPNNTTKSTAAEFYEVDSVTTDGTLSTAVSIGIGTTGHSQWFVVNPGVTPINIGFGVSVTGTDTTWTIQQTTYNVQAAEPPSYAIINATDTNLVSQTTSTQRMFPLFGAARCSVSSPIGTTLVLNINQAGIV